jgi:membrane protease YdiL (CAAX protease family)
MVDRKSLTWYLILSFGLAWIFFLVPLLFGEVGSESRQYASLAAWAVAMWMPGIAAILVTRFVAKSKISSLNLGQLGPKKYYVWAWLVFLVLSICTGLLTVAFRAGQFDPTFTLIRESMVDAPGGDIIPAWGIVVIQIIFSLTLAPLINTVLALGEELGWRGYLLPELLPLGTGKAILISGVIWGIWHAPAVLQGLNYPSMPVAGVFLMIVFTVLSGTILSWLYLNTRSPWTPALGHGALNATAGISILFMKDVDLAMGGSLTSIIGFIPLGIFVGWLVWTNRLQVRDSTGGGMKDPV